MNKQQTQTHPHEPRKTGAQTLAGNLAKFIAPLAIVPLFLTGCAANENPSVLSESQSAGSAALQTISGSGASSQTAAQEAWRAGYSGTVNYDPVGSGAGREAFSSGGAAFAGSDVPFKTEDLKSSFANCEGGIVEVPAYISPIAVAYNLEGVQLKLDAESIAKIFTGKITNWNDEALAELNKGTALPDLKITAVHRSDKSGTTGNFTDYLAQAAPKEWSAGEVEEWPADLNGEAAEKTQGVRETLANTKGAIGYLDASQAGDLGVASVKSGDVFVTPTAEASVKTVGGSSLETGRGSADLAVDLNRTSVSGAYPLVMVSYLIGCEQYKDAATGTAVKAYFEHVISESGQKAAAEHAGSAPLQADAALAEKVAKAVEAMK
ncbi:MAG: phosphate ABC transporter substrate-binding protein PstS [Propionibacteriaceae bacterium]|jgi:phosphate transport system substrate-binding protein|nr:phosphate ABC transporter substrate-binding protein PstS [Propionibacteriaceae bacterium]